MDDTDTISISGFDSSTDLRTMEVFVYVCEKEQFPVTIKDTGNFYNLAELPKCSEIVRMFGLDDINGKVVKREVMVRDIPLNDEEKLFVRDKMR